MSRWTRESTVFLCTAAIALVAFGHWSTTGSSDTASDEDVRIYRHLLHTEDQLRRVDVSRLTDAQRAARESHLNRLAVYREGRVFPHNHRFQGQRVPFFVDAHGTLCAMAYLIQESGHGAVVSEVVRAANNATVLELAARSDVGPSLLAWLKEAGLTVMEAQRIQPAYGIRSDVEEVSSDAYLVGSLSVGAGNLVTIGFGTLGRATASQRRWLHGAGVGFGVLGVGLGVGRAVDEMDGFAAVNLTLGALSILVNAIALGAADDSGQSRAVSVQWVEPWRPFVRTGPGGRHEYGIAVRF